MLDRILENKEDVKFILVEDDYNSYGIPLISAFLTEYKKRYDKIFLLQYDYPKQGSIYTQIKDVDNTVKCLDGFTDPLNWDNRNYQNDIIGYNLKNTLSKMDANLVVINSLTPLLINLTANEIYREIHKFRVKLQDCKVIALLHTDVHDSLEIKIVEKLADAILKLSHAADKQNLTLCSTLLKKSNGKQLTKAELFKINSNFEVIIKDANDKSLEAIPKAIDPASNLTFNLTLKDDEKRARKELVLPYTQASNTESGGGKIIYNLDSVDDFDEEDPDDDLDI